MVKTEKNYHPLINKSYFDYLNIINNIKDNCYFVLQFMYQARIIINRDTFENDGLFIDNAYCIKPSSRVYNNDKSIEVKYNTKTRRFEQ